MAEQKSFIERVKESAISYAPQYKKYFVDYEYLLCSEAFCQANYYIIQSHADNYRHLLGVESSIDAETFFMKCQDGTLEETDYSFVKRGQSETEVKGSVRRKINAFPFVIGIFSSGTYVEEDFNKTRIRCSVAAGKNECTLGFTVSMPSKPMTLLNGNQLDTTKSKPLELVLRKESGSDKFDEIIVGNEEMLKKYYPKIQPVLSDRLKDIYIVSDDIKKEIEMI